MLYFGKNVDNIRLKRYHSRKSKVVAFSRSNEQSMFEFVIYRF